MLQAFLLHVQVKHEHSSIFFYYESYVVLDSLVEK